MIAELLRSAGARLRGVTHAPLPKAGAEAYVAASHSHPDMRRWQPRAGSADADLLPELGTIVSRSRDLKRNHGVAEGAQQTIVDNVVGRGLRLSSTPNYRVLGKSPEWAEELGNGVESLWRDYANSRCMDAAGQLNFDSLTTQIFCGAWGNGDGLALPLWVPTPGEKYATKLQVIESDRLSNPQYRPDNATIRGGVEIDPFGRPLAYHISATHPGDRIGYFTSIVNKWERIPATTEWGRRRVIHAYDPERSGQTRGKPALASVMRQFKVLGDYTNAELKAAVVNAKVAMYTKTTLGQSDLLELLSSGPRALEQYQAQLQGRGVASMGMNDGMIVPLNIGEEISGFTPARPVSSFDPFVTMLFRHIAVGLNIPYELLMKDFSKTNYSSARSALLEAWRFFDGRRKWISTYWAQPVYELFFEEIVNKGLIDAPDFYTHKDAYCAAEWIGDARGWVDPVKEITAVKLRMDLNISTLKDECAEQAKDWKEVLEQKAREKLYIKILEEKHGIKFDAADLTPAAVAAPADNAAAATDDSQSGDAPQQRQDAADAAAEDRAVMILAQSLQAQGANMSKAVDAFTAAVSQPPAPITVNTNVTVPRRGATRTVANYAANGDVLETLTTEIEDEGISA